MTEAHTHEPEQKAPAKKRVTRKKVVHHKIHAELEIEAFQRKLDVLIQSVIYPYAKLNVNVAQIRALQKKIAKRKAQV